MHGSDIDINSIKWVRRMKVQGMSTRREWAYFKSEAQSRVSIWGSDIDPGDPTLVPIFGPWAEWHHANVAWKLIETAEQ